MTKWLDLLPRSTIQGITREPSSVNVAERGILPPPDYFHTCFTFTSGRDVILRSCSFTPDVLASLLLICCSGNPVFYLFVCDSTRLFN